MCIYLVYLLIKNFKHMKYLPLFNQNYIRFHKDFEKYVCTRGYGRGKGSHYASNVQEFLFFLEQIHINDIAEVRAVEIISYHQYLSMRPNQKKDGCLSNAMIGKQLFSLRLFFDYLIEVSEIESSPARLPKFSRSECKERNIVTTDEILKLFESCETRQDNAFLSLAYGCGLRRSELEKLNITDVHFQKGIIVIRDSKNHKSRVVPLSESVLRDLREYIINERMRDEKACKIVEYALFINEKGARRKGWELNKRLKFLIEKTKNIDLINKSITLHCLRHSIATHLIDNGASIEFVQQFLGHSSIDTAHLYAKKRRQHLKIITQLK